MKPPKASLDHVLAAMTRKDLFQCLRYAQARWSYFEFIEALLRGRLTHLTSATTVGVHDDQVLTMPEVARLLTVSVGRAYELGRSGELPTVTLGERQVRVRRSDLREYLQKRRTLADRAQDQ